jgi:hypothetical protein
MAFLFVYASMHTVAANVAACELMSETVVSDFPAPKNGSLPACFYANVIYKNKHAFLTTFVLQFQRPVHL